MRRSKKLFSVMVIAKKFLLENNFFSKINYFLVQKNFFLISFEHIFALNRNVFYAKN